MGALIDGPNGSSHRMPNIIRQKDYVRKLMPVGPLCLSIIEYRCLTVIHWVSSLDGFGSVMIVFCLIHTILLLYYFL
jgi:hypothetical protein